MFEIRLMQKPVIQTIVLVLAVLFIFDLGYRLFLEKPYYLQPAKDGAVYRIDKRSGEVYLIYMNKMRRVEDVTPSPSAMTKFDPFKYGTTEKEIQPEKVSYYIDWGVTFIIIAVFVCVNAFVWIVIKKKRKYDSLLP
jgi:hypothetical protein